mmetsp:Transcript_47926/g.94551  ORF Transcript_47926/g.94551 Transcript_47926/m.94551 type:complete len:102 (+) Transcript_47926:76-381(+)
MRCLDPLPPSDDHPRQCYHNWGIATVFVSANKWFGFGCTSGGASLHMLPVDAAGSTVSREVLLRGHEQPLLKVETTRALGDGRRLILSADEAGHIIIWVEV